MPIEWRTKWIALFGGLFGMLIGLMLQWPQLFQSSQSLRSLMIVIVLAGVGAGIAAAFSAIRNLFVL